MGRTIRSSSEGLAICSLLPEKKKKALIVPQGSHEPGSRVLI